jgi:hypothetical protein
VNPRFARSATRLRHGVLPVPPGVCSAVPPEDSLAIEQISVFIENETGGLADVVDVLARSAIDIRAMSIADQTDFGIVRLIVNDTERASSALKDAGFTVRRTPVVAVLIPDRPGGLATTLNALRGVAVEYMYAFVRKSGEQAVVVFRFDDLDRAIATLREAGATLLEAAELQAP